MKRILFFLLFLSFAAFSRAQDNAATTGSLSTYKQKAKEAKTRKEKLSAFTQLESVYDSLAAAYESLYRDSARQWGDSIKALAIQTLATDSKANDSKGPVNTDLRFRLYTDLVGLNSDQPNGLLQNQFYLNWDLNKKDPDKKVTWVRNFVFPIIDLWKVKSEDSLRYRLVDYDTLLRVNNVTGIASDSIIGPVRHIHTLDLIRHARMQVSGKLNIFQLDLLDKKVRVFVDVFGTLYRTGLRDTLLANESDQRFNVTSIGGGGNVKLRFGGNSRFRLDVSYTSFGLRLLNNHVYQRYGSLYYPVSDPRNSMLDVEQQKKSSALQGIGIYCAEVKYKGKNDVTEEGKNDDENEVFLKLSLFTNPILGGNSAYNYNNNYFQVQIGVNQSIDKLWALFKI